MWEGRREVERGSALCLRNAEGEKNRAEEKRKYKERSRKEAHTGRKSILCLEERPIPKVQLC